MLRPYWLPAALVGLALLGLAPPSQSQRPTIRDASRSYAPPLFCAECHQDLWESYRLTGMANSFAPLPTTQDQTAPFPLDGSYDHQASESRFLMETREGRHYQRREQLELGEEFFPAVEKAVDYVLGSGAHARSFLHRTSRNTLIELPLAWYAEDGGRWAMNPGFDQPDHWGFRREITYECMFCHNGYPSGAVDSVPGAETAFPASLPAGIDCQRCHGPGLLHAQLARVPGTAPQQIRAAIVNPARLAPERQLEVCMQCHLETTSAPLPDSIRRYDREPFSYIPGQPLGDFRLYFDHQPGSGHDDKFEIVSAAYRLRQSACFRGSAGALLCTTCHDPHGKSTPGAFVTACLNCHQSALSSLTASGAHPASTDCADCHMAKRRADDVVHAVMTDHRIQRFRPTEDVTEPKRELSSGEAASYRGPVAPYYPQPWPSTPDAELYLAVAQTRDGSNRAEGIAQLETAIAQHRPSHAQFYLELADAFNSAAETERALPYYRQAVQRQPAAANLRKLAAALRSLGRLQEAATTAEAALRASPQDFSSWNELGLIRTNQGRDRDAVSAYEKALALNPDLPETLNNLGAVWMRRADAARAESAFRAAIRADPANAEAHGNLGNLLAAEGDFPRGEMHFRIALRLRPSDDAARYNYALALTRSGDLVQAKEQLLSAISANPERAEARVLLGDLLRAEGQTAQALEHYRRALQSRPTLTRAHLSLGLALVNAGDVEEGLVHLRTAAQGSDEATREEALGALRQLGFRP